MTTAVVPRYIPANSIEDRFGYLVTAKSEDDERVYLSRGGHRWGAIGAAEFYDDPLNAAEAIKGITERGEGEIDGILLESIQLVRVIGILIPTVISEAELRKRRKAAALLKLTEEELEALGLTLEGNPLPPKKERR